MGHHAECANRRDPEAEQEQGDEQGGSKLEGQPHACKGYELGTFKQKQSSVRSENKMLHLKTEDICVHRHLTRTNG